MNVSVNVPHMTCDSYASLPTMTNEDIRQTVRIPINHTVRAKMLLIKCTAGSQVLIQEFLVHIEKIS